MALKKGESENRQQANDKKIKLANVLQANFPTPYHFRNRFGTFASMHTVVLMSSRPKGTYSQSETISCAIASKTGIFFASQKITSRKNSKAHGRFRPKTQGFLGNKVL